MKNQSEQLSLEPALEEIRGMLQDVDPNFYPQLISCLQGHIQLIKMTEVYDGGNWGAR